MKARASSLLAIAAPLLFAACGCHSYHIETTVENRTGGAIQLLEVEYPSASFGADDLLTLAKAANDAHTHIHELRRPHTANDGKR